MSTSTLSPLPSSARPEKINTAKSKKVPNRSHEYSDHLIDRLLTDMMIGDVGGEFVFVGQERLAREIAAHPMFTEDEKYQIFFSSDISKGFGWHVFTITERATPSAEELDAYHKVLEGPAPETVWERVDGLTAHIRTRLDHLISRSKELLQSLQPSGFR